MSALISPGDCQRKDLRHNRFTASYLFFFFSFLSLFPRFHILLQALSIIPPCLLSSSIPSSTLSSLLYLYPAATIGCHRAAEPSSLLSASTFPIALPPPRCATSSRPCVCLLALRKAELARLSRFLLLILREMTMLQSAAIISQIKALKLNLARLKK